MLKPSTQTPRLRRLRPLAGLGLLMLLQACTAGLLSPAAMGTGATQDPNMQSVAAAAVDHIPSVSACTSGAPAPRGLRRLTRTELNNTVRDLFADPNAPQSQGVFSGDATAYGFDNVQTALGVRDNQAMVVASFAETVGTYAAGHAAALSACQTLDVACRSTFIRTFGRRALRMPLSDAQVADYDALMATAPTFEAGVTIVVTAMLQSPYFLYRTELGTPDPNAAGQFVLTQAEIAQALSYTFTASMPDAELQAAADAGQLNTPAALSAQGRRLLATPAAHAAVGQFFMEWLQVATLDKQARSEGTDVLAPAVKTQMQAETRAFVDDTVFAHQGSFAELMGRDVTFMGPELAQFYTGSTALTPAVPEATSGGLTAVHASAMGRLPGVLGQGGVLAAASQPTYASPTLRGRMLRMRILCGAVPPPPPGIPPLPAASGQQTLRQRFSQHASGASCASCHVLMDPLAFPFGGYDTLGRARSGGTEDGLPLDLSGAIAGNDARDAGPAVAGPADLIAQLAQSPEAAACLGRHWSMYALGRLSWSQDACTFNAVASGAAAGQNNLQALLLALVAAPSFTHRVQDT